MKKKKSKKRRRSRWAQIEDYFGERAVELYAGGKLIRLFDEVTEGDRHRVGVVEKKDSRRTPKRKTQSRHKKKGHRGPLPEGEYVRITHNKKVHIGRERREGTKIDIFYSHYPNKKQREHTHAIIFDDPEINPPKNLLIYDRSLNRNRFRISPGPDCAGRRKGEDDIDIGPFEIPDPERFMREVIEKHGGKIPWYDHPDWKQEIKADHSREAQQLREEIEFDSDQEWLEWRGRPDDHADYWNKDYKQYNEEYSGNLEARYEAWRETEAFTIPNPELHEP